MEEKRSPAVSRGELAWLAGMLVVAAILRLIAVAAFSDVEPEGDQVAYVWGAEALLEGSPYKEARGPAYSGYLALAQVALGEGLRGARLGNLLLGLALMVGVWALGRRLFSFEVGLLAAGAIGLHPRYVTFPIYFFSEALFAVCVVWGIYCALRGIDSRARWCFLAGLLFGVGALTRDMLFGFVPFFALGVAWLAPASGRLRKAGALLLAPVLVVAPWTLRNYSVYEELIPIGFADGIPLFEGNFPADTTAEVKEERHRLYTKFLKQSVSGGKLTSEEVARLYSLADEVMSYPIEEREVARARLLRDFYLETGVRVEVNRRMRRAALRWIGERQPLWIVEKLAENGPKLVQPSATSPQLWTVGELAGTPRRVRAIQVLWWSTLLPLHVLLLLLAPVGMAQARLRSGEVLPLIYLGISAALFIVANAGFSRFQVGYEWVLVLFASSLAMRGMPTSPSRRRVAVALVALVLLSQFLAPTPWKLALRDLVGG